MTFFNKAFGRPIRIGYIRPQKEQAKTDFDRLETALSRSTEFQIVYDQESQDQAKEESNSNHRPPNGLGLAVI